MSSWHQGKVFIEHTLRIEHGTLHVMVGMLLWLVFALLARRHWAGGVVAAISSWGLLWWVMERLAILRQ